MAIWSLYLITVLIVISNAQPFWGGRHYGRGRHRMMGHGRGPPWMERRQGDTWPMRRRFGGTRWSDQFEDKPVCMCAPLEECVNDKKRQLESCQTNTTCTDYLKRAGADVNAMEQCFNDMRKEHETFRRCMVQKLGKNCNDSSDAIDTEFGEINTNPMMGRGGMMMGFRRHHGHHRGHHYRRHQIPTAPRSYMRCVHRCVAQDDQLERRETRGPGFMHNRRGGRGSCMSGRMCLEQLQCRPIQHSPTTKRRAAKSCTAQTKFDKPALFEKMCKCVKAAGFEELRCPNDTEQQEEPEELWMF